MKAFFAMLLPEQAEQKQRGNQKIKLVTFVDNHQRPTHLRHYTYLPSSQLHQGLE